MNLKLKKLAEILLDMLPTQNLILMESMPDFSGSTKALFDELISRGLNKHYIIVWKVSSSKNRFPQYKNVHYVHKHRTLEIARHLAKLFISENRYFRKVRPEGQFLLHIIHGGAIKDVRNYYKAPDNMDEVIELSPYLLPSDAINFGFRPEIMKPFGLPRNDDLLKKRTDLHMLFPDKPFDKLIYWLPTFRQHNGAGKITHSNITIPIIYNEENAKIVNDVAKENNVLLVVKPHFAQDVTYVKKLSLSNLVFIDDRFLSQNGLNNYEFLNSVDALLSDYSSVYFDYLLTDRPIGLCWEDYDEYKRREGFIIDPEIAMAGGEKLYNAEDLCAFIRRIASGEDALSQERKRIKDLIFPDGGKCCTGIVADRVEEILSGL